MRIPLFALPEKITDILNTIKSIGLIDMIDIACVSVLLYYLYKFIRDRRAGKLALGVLLLFVIQIVSSVMDMYVMQYIMQNIFQIGFITLVILFQPEIRSVLEKFGAQPLKGFKSIASDAKSATQITLNTIDEVVSAVTDLAESKTGALIVFERTTKLGDMILTGTVIDAYPAAFLIKNIFFNKAPLHDGAMIIRDNRLHAGGCLLPLSNNPDIIKDLGTRHRAGIGMSENSDAVVIIVSEETGVISTAVEGVLTRNYDSETLYAFLRQELTAEETDKRRFDLLGKVRKKNS
ncbi:MAG: diadenylate cyclase CdaA [Clostridia bacterium]|nr:diadenylate cyclase CdaA [Clostridia bacterium]MBQ8368680.1 diadenylate cyclase CdaA [Clostridia bacterium]MBQ8513064.1 diadenylate cyclase CdaA [Clostridia bacterium]